MGLMSSVEIFDKYADRYDKWYERNKITAENEIRAVEHSLRDSPRPCIEIGGGTGYFSSRFECINIDPSISMLRYSRAREIESIQGYGEYLPIRDSSAGTVLIVVTLCFVKSPERVIEESKRILMRRGRVVACIIPKESSWGRYYEKRRSESPFYSVARFLSREELFKLLREQDLEIERVVGVLRYGPEDEPRQETPEIDNGEHGFICTVARKP